MAANYFRVSKLPQIIAGRVIREKLPSVVINFDDRDELSCNLARSRVNSLVQSYGGTANISVYRRTERFPSYPEIGESPSHAP